MDKKDRLHPFRNALSAAVFDGGSLPLTLPPTFIQRERDSGFEFCPFGQVGQRGQAGSFRFSSDLPPVWFEQLASELSVVRYTRGQPTRSFVRILGRRAEALDCVVYAFAARALLNLDYDQRRADLLTEAAPVPKRAPVLASSWMKR